MRDKDDEIVIVDINQKIAKCPNCDGDLAAKSGRNGLFAGCTNYPKCKTTSNIQLDSDGKLALKEQESNVTDMECEKCGKPMVKKFYKGRSFLACSGYPECKNTKSYK